MIKRIASRCPRCGRVELGIDDITLVVSPREGRGWYLFDCTGCVQQVVRWAPSYVVSALRSLPVAQWIVPAEVLDRRRPGEEPPPLSIDDLLDVMLWLRTSDTISTRYWHAVPDGRLQCDVCPRACRLHEGQRGCVSFGGGPRTRSS